MPFKARSSLLPALAPDPGLRRELYFLNLYRMFEAALLALVMFSPVGGLFAAPREPGVGTFATIGYLLASVSIALWSRRAPSVRKPAVVGLLADITAATLALHAIPDASTGISMLLLFNVGATALLLPLRYGMAGAMLAAAALLDEYLWSRLGGQPDPSVLAERVMFGISGGALAILIYLVGRQMREAAALAERRGEQVANLAEVNELIIRRMRSGVLLVDERDHVRLANESALALLGEEVGNGQLLAQVSPELGARLQLWRQGEAGPDLPLRLGPEAREVLPRFAHLYASGENTLVFLDDASHVSRRAESLTIAAMGRFSASLAHEIRNPLAAISYATQLLEESPDIRDGDRRMLEIIHQQCLRTNGIVESVLGLARRERARPERVDLAAALHAFVRDLQPQLTGSEDSIRVTSGATPVPALVDPAQLHQVLTALVQNARHHGRQPGEPAKVGLATLVDGVTPVIEVSDRGPGVAEGAVAELFRPFHTTSEHGTGLGLYIARELCRANGGSLDYVPVPAGGACFRIVLPAPHGLLPRDAFREAAPVG